MEFGFNVNRSKGVCDLCFDKCWREDSHQFVEKNIVSTAFVCFGTVKSMVAKYVMLFVALS